MNRIKLIRKIFKKEGFNTYLEIGTETGGSFFPIWAKNKIAIDPEFKIKTGKKLRWLIKNPHNFFNHYFEETSDSFFQNHASIISSMGGLDVALVDGLHTYRAALQDVLNSLEHLNNDGIIILHDCYPPSEAAALPTKFFPSKEEQKVNGWNGTWCGDVWKSIVYLKNHLGAELEVCVIDTDLGLGIVRKKSLATIPVKIDEKAFSEIDKLTYSDLMKDPVQLLDLKPVNHTAELLSSLK